MNSRVTGRKGVDWSALRARLARAQLAVEESCRLSPAQARAILEERALALARVPAAAAPAAEVIEVITFALADEAYALETCHVREVVRLTEYTPLPGAPPFLVGVVNLRGEILAVMDLRPFFGMRGQALTDLSRVLVLGGERPEFGVVADAAHEVRTLRRDEILEPPASAGGPGREYVRGVTAAALIVLDGAALLQDGRLFIEQDETQGR